MQVAGFATDNGSMPGGTGLIHHLQHPARQQRLPHSQRWAAILGVQCEQRSTNVGESAMIVQAALASPAGIDPQHESRSASTTACFHFHLSMLALQALSAGVGRTFTAGSNVDLSTRFFGLMAQKGAWLGRTLPAHCSAAFTGQRAVIRVMDTIDEH